MDKILFLRERNKIQKLLPIKIIFKYFLTKMKRHLELTPSTAHKRSHFAHQESLHFQSVSNLSHSPNLMTPSHRRNGNGIGSKISSLRSTIDDLISCVSDKRNVQKGAVQRVCDVNSELCGDLTQEYEFPRAFSVNSLAGHNAEEFHKTSVFGEASTYIEHGKSQYEPEQQDESFRIKQSLNSQMASNNQLMSKLKSLQQEHEYLRGQQSQVSSFEIEENRRLKEQLTRLQRQSTQGYTVENLWREFCELKEQNQRLRQETIMMLKANKGNMRSEAQYQIRTNYAY